MKKITLCLMLIFALIIVPGAIFAAEGDVAQVGDNTYATLKDALVAGKNITLLKEVELNETINITGDVVIDLNNFDIISTADPVFKVTNGSIEVKGNGKIKGSVDVFYLVGNTVLNGEAIKAEAKIGANVAVVSETSNCIYLKGNGAKADVYGNLKTSSVEYAAIQGNGIKKGNIDNGNTVLNIYEGANVISTNNLAIYHPQSGALNVYGGNIEGTTGIEMRAGTLTVTGGEIKGTWAPSISSPNGNGSTTLGAGIALSQHSTTQETKVIVKGGTIKGYTALFQGNVQGNDDEAVDKVSIEISGGRFEAIAGGNEAIYSDNKTDFITGGTFVGTDNINEYLAPDIALKQDENGNFVADEKTITVEGLENVVNSKEAEGILLDTLDKYFEEDPDLAETYKNTNITIMVEVYELTSEDVGFMPMRLWENFVNTLNEKDKNATMTKKFVDIYCYAGDNIGMGFDLTELVKPLTFEISLPENLPDVADGYERVFYAVRQHANFGDNGEVTHDFSVIDAKPTDDGKALIISANQFSLFGIGYSDVEKTVVTPPSGDEGNKDETTVTPPASSEGATGEGETGKVEEKPVDKVEDKKEDANIENSETGDNVLVFAGLAIVSIVGLGIVTKKYLVKNY